MKRETESLLKAAQNNIKRRNYINAKIERSTVVNLDYQSSKMRIQQIGSVGVKKERKKKEISMTGREK